MYPAILSKAFSSITALMKWEKSFGSPIVKLFTSATSSSFTFGQRLSGM